MILKKLKKLKELKNLENEIADLQKQIDATEKAGKQDELEKLQLKLQEKQESFL